ncbi:hypothetical protein SAMD00019534_075100 [Acytostelium subglobosum LB1]|uniref:hypothetical protein n=1 Tax=Acytostelium subglobosum LB1 TaxID=1410327 RepID=UPI000644BE05|nr:hypothetical protein SAMD00019534_075100 [Acytostelium subglobosum LB1]GAM24335.1 hypothetical protein SAMD00019534_075100 [Acytostelium subglobosum LB1]|eukprot:XP_012752661.1 hypothetical protein SAMD00019534_075100 [Acytostelium subglobosum LB1]
MGCLCSKHEDGGYYVDCPSFSIDTFSFRRLNSHSPTIVPKKKRRKKLSSPQRRKKQQQNIQIQQHHTKHGQQQQQQQQYVALIGHGQGHGQTLVQSQSQSQPLAQQSTTPLPLQLPTDSFQIGGGQMAVQNVTPNRLPRISTKETIRALTGRDMDTGYKVVNEYVIVRRIGVGAYGKVHLCYHKDSNLLYAIKVISKLKLKRMNNPFKANGYEDVMREIAIMKKLNHPNVVKMYEVINDPDEDCIYIVMEYIEGGSIMTTTDWRTHSMSENLARKYFRDIVYGLEYLHEQRVIHRDIKPENLLVNKDGVVKITDFSVSHIFQEEYNDVLKSSAGSPAFLAPELCIEDNGVSISGKAVDVWALGVSLYCLVFACTPFNNSMLMLNNNNNNNFIDDEGYNLYQVYENIKCQELQFPRSISDDLKDLFRRMMDKNPGSRISIREIRSHPWTSMRGTLPMREVDHSVLSVTDQEVNNAITSDAYHTLDDLSSSSESSGVLLSECTHSKSTYSNINNINNNNYSFNQISNNMNNNINNINFNNFNNKQQQNNEDALYSSYSKEEDTMEEDDDDYDYDDDDDDDDDDKDNIMIENLPSRPSLPDLLTSIVKPLTRSYATRSVT